MPPYYLLNSSCVTSCPPGQYADASNATSGQCLPCDASVYCLECQGTAQFCTACLGVNLYYLDQVLGNCWNACPSSLYASNVTEMLCLSTCPDGYYNDAATMSCQPCDVSCPTCLGPLATDCLTCPPSLYFYTQDYVLMTGSCTDNCDQYG